MATITQLGPFGHLRAEPNQYILRYRRGELAQQGAGLASWFLPLNTALAQVPVEDVETTFLLKERSLDLQEVVVQCTLTYRVTDPQRAAARVNFTLSLKGGVWSEQPLERLAGLWVQRVQRPARAYLTGVTLVEAVQRGAEVLSAVVEQALRQDETLSSMGLELVNFQVIRVAPSAELEKALQTPTREAVQQQADEAIFQRRALAVEKERAIKENELSTEIELARRQEQLVRQQSSNRLLEVDQQVEERRRLAEADAQAEAERLSVWKDAPARVLLGLAAQELAGKIEGIQQLNLSPDLLVALQRAMSGPSEPS